MKESCLLHFKRLFFQVFVDMPPDMKDELLKLLNSPQDYEDSSLALPTAPSAASPTAPSAAPPSAPRTAPPAASHSAPPAAHPTAPRTDSPAVRPTAPRNFLRTNPPAARPTAPRTDSPHTNPRTTPSTALLRIDPLTTLCNIWKHPHIRDSYCYSCCSLYRSSYCNACRSNCFFYSSLYGSHDCSICSSCCSSEFNSCYFSCTLHS